MRTLHLNSITCAAAVLVFCSLSSAQATKYQQDEDLGMESHVGKLTGHARDAAMNYRRYCTGCHGDLGDGEGENAVWLDPKPRNFTLATFKCRSTPTGTLPTDEDLFNTVGRGLESSNMPSWNPLSNQMRADLVAYVKHFSERWKTEKPGSPIEIPTAPAVTADRIKAGQAVFQKLECWKCHGVEGRGNGPSADNVKPDEAWDLVFYLRTLQPMHTKEKEIARQLGLKPINPNAPAAPANETKPEGENK